MSDPLRVAMLEGESNPPVFIRRLMEGLAEQGHQVFVFHFGKNKNSTQKNLHYFSLGSNKSKLQLLQQSLKYAVKDSSSLIESFSIIKKGNRKDLQKHNLNLLIRILKPDLLHVQWPSLLNYVQGILADQRIPVVLSQRGYQINVRPFVNRRYWVDLHSYFSKIVGFHSVSLAISRKANLIFDSPTKINEVVYTGIDLRDFPFNESYKKDSSLKMISIGRPHWKKSYQDAIRACAILKKKNIDFEYTIVGGSGNEELLFLVDHLDLKEEIKITGRISQKEVYSLMTESSILVVSSVEEGLPNVLVEAMALGIPVLSTNCGGVEELIIHEKEGWVVPMRDPETMAEELEKFYNLPPDRINSIRLAGKKKIEKQHQKYQMISGMEKLYERVLEKDTN